jgi:ABC-type sugar transport system ATPase subunit
MLVSHRLSDLMTVSDRIYVLRDGRVVANLQTTQTTEYELLRLMAGLDEARTPVSSNSEQQ